MAIAASDILLKLSTPSGSAGNSTAGTPATSLGKYVSTTAVTDATLSNLFDPVSGSEAAAGMTDYRCYFVHNNHASLTWSNVQVTIASQTAGGGTITIALDNLGVTALASASAQSATIASETTAPTGVGTFGNGPLTIGNMAPGTVQAIWLKRVVTAGATALNPDGVVLTYTGDTLP
jgi:hypothetical protein